MSKDYKLPKRAKNPVKSGHCPKLNVFPVLGPDEASYYQSLIGILRRITEIGPIYINTKVSLLSSNSAMPRQGHTEAVLHIMCQELQSTCDSKSTKSNGSKHLRIEVSAPGIK